MEIEAETIENANEMADKACRDLLHNPIMEGYKFKIEEI
jgi:phosphoribosylformylglycinamidine (FGAM) synthase PurS component